MAGAKELHRSTIETNRAAALRTAEKIRAEPYVWFNELFDRETQDFRQVTTLTDAEISDIPHKVYHDYQEEW